MRKDLIIVAVVSAMVASAITVLASGPNTPFSDVSENAYYARSVDRMQSMGVVSGYANGKFGPNDSVTRGQVVTMLDRYDQALLNTFPGKPASGAYDLIKIICDANLSIANASTKETYEKLCEPLKEVLLKD